MAGRRVGVALIEILARIARTEGRRFTLDNLREEVRQAGEGSPWAPIAPLLAVDVDDLTLPEFRRVVASIRAYVRSEAARFDDDLRDLILNYATIQQIVRTLTDRDTLARMARMEPVAVPDRWPSDLERAGQLVRSGHAEGSPHWELPVSSQLSGSRLVSYLYMSGQEITAQTPQDEIAQFLVAHDSDEFVYYLGRPQGSPAGSGQLPIYLEGERDPYQCVKCPIQLEPGQWFLYDGNSPHYWFAAEGSVAFFVAASSNQMYRKPVAFRSEHGDSVPGGSYPLFERGRRRRPKKPGDASFTRAASPQKNPERTSYLFGRRLRRRRNGFGISAKEIQRLKTRGRGITANIIGKIENDALSKLHIQLVAELAEAVDVPLLELFPREPVDARARPIPEIAAGRRAQPLGNDGSPYAVVPYVLRPMQAPDSFVFRQGEADVVLLPLEGAVDVYVAPDPLLLVLELIHYSMHHAGRSTDPEFRIVSRQLHLSHSAVERLKRVHLLWHDRVESREAYHFNTALPHAVFAAPNTEPLVIAVTTRSDVHLPSRWFESATPHAGANAPRTTSGS